MFEIGWSEILVIVVVALIVIGPKDLPRALRSAGQILGRVRRMAGEFQSTFNAAIREAERQAELDTLREELAKAKAFDPLKDVRNQLNEMESPTPPSSHEALAPDPDAPVHEAAAPQTPESEIAAIEAGATARAALNGDRVASEAKAHETHPLETHPLETQALEPQALEPQGANDERRIAESGPADATPAPSAVPSHTVTPGSST